MTLLPRVQQRLHRRRVTANAVRDKKLDCATVEQRLPRRVLLAAHARARCALSDSARRSCSAVCSIAARSSSVPQSHDRQNPVAASQRQCARAARSSSQQQWREAGEHQHAGRGAAPAAARGRAPAQQRQAASWRQALWSHSACQLTPAPHSSFAAEGQPRVPREAAAGSALKAMRRTPPTHTHACAAAQSARTQHNAERVGCALRDGCAR
jgi:hypothetical protein